MEMKDKITMLQTEVQQFKDEVLYREKVLVKLRKGQGASLKERIQIKDETAKCVVELKEKKVLLFTRTRRLDDTSVCSHVAI